MRHLAALVLEVNCRADAVPLNKSKANVGRSYKAMTLRLASQVNYTIGSITTAPFNSWPDYRLMGQGKIGRYYCSMMNRSLFEDFYLPGLRFRHLIIKSPVSREPGEPNNSRYLVRQETCHPKTLGEHQTENYRF